MHLSQRIKVCIIVLIAMLMVYVQNIPSVCAQMIASVFAEEAFQVEVASDHEAKPPDTTDPFLQVEIIREIENPPAYAGKRILIYHTHTYEAYEKSADQDYKQIEKWRTSDNDYNVVAVGNALAASLTSLGLTVVHDEAAYEPPTLDDAYERSLIMLERRKEEGESFDLYIDLHRDAIASTSTIKRTVNIGGTDIARFMVLVGQGTTGGYAEKPNFEANLAIAQEITRLLNAQYSGLARDVKIKTGRFNQHIADGCILIECGMNTNTLDEVLAGIPYLAYAIAETLAE